MGNCNICKEESRLTEDHVPPKCCSNKGNIKFYRLFDKNIYPNKKPWQAQKGIHFKTICDNCNNRLLGHELDPFLGDLQTQIISAASQCQSIHNYINIKIRINKVCRAIIGHLLAAFPDYYDGGIENALREYFFDKSSKGILGQHLYLWINNEKRVAVARNIGIALDPIFDGAIISLLKFPGAAFMLSNKKIDDNLLDLFDITSDNFEEEVNINLGLSSIYSKTGEERTTEWPLIETDSRVFLVSPNTQHKSLFSTLVDV